MGNIIMTFDWFTSCDLAQSRQINLSPGFSVERHISEKDAQNVTMKSLPLRFTVFVVDGIVVVEERFLLRVLNRRVRYCKTNTHSC